MYSDKLDIKVNIKDISGVHEKFINKIKIVENNPLYHSNMINYITEKMLDDNSNKLPILGYHILAENIDKDYIFKSTDKIILIYLYKNEEYKEYFSAKSQPITISDFLKINIIE